MTATGNRLSPGGRLGPLCSRVFYDVPFVYRSLGLFGSPRFRSDPPWKTGDRYRLFDEARSRFFAFRTFRYPFCAAYPKDHSFECADWHAVVSSLTNEPVYSRIWRLEGIATDLLADAWKGTGAVPSLCGLAPLNDPFAYANLPLHTGAGMALARELLRPRDTDLNPERIVETFVSACDGASVPEFRRCFFDPIGLMSRNLAPALVDGIAAVLMSHGSGDRGAFWHGTGRGYYFNPVQMGRLRKRVHRLAGEISKDWDEQSACENFVSGFFTALTLVNLQAPFCIARFLDAFDPVADRLVFPALVDGVISALRIWTHQKGDADSIDRLVATLVTASGAALPSRVALCIECAAGDLDFPIQDCFAFAPDRSPA